MNEGLNPEQAKQLVTPNNLSIFLKLERPLLGAPMEIVIDLLNGLDSKTDIFGGIQNSPKEIQEEVITKTNIIMQEIAQRN